MLGYREMEFLERRGQSGKYFKIKIPTMNDPSLNNLRPDPFDPGMSVGLTSLSTHELRAPTRPQLDADRAKLISVVIRWTPYIGLSAIAALLFNDGWKPFYWCLGLLVTMRGIFYVFESWSGSFIWNNYQRAATVSEITASRLRCTA